MNGRRVLFVGGGSGGHINPMLAVMEAFQKTGLAECHYVGTAKDMQYPSIVQSMLRFERHIIRSGKLNRFLTWKHVPELGNVAVGAVQAQFLLRRLKPRIIFSKGGAASVPIAWAAARLDIPVFCHETDVAAGLANRMVSRTAARVFTAFPVEAYAGLSAEKARYVGQPVRPEFYAPDTREPVRVGEWVLNPALPLILVTGGSQGAHGLNLLVQSVWPELLEVAQLVHITGPGDAEEFGRLASRLALPQRSRLQVVSFIQNEMALLLRRSALIVSRSGGSLFEIAAVGRPAVLVPLPTAAQDHQRANARVLQDAKAAVIVDQDQVTASQFSGIVRGLLEDESERARLSQAISRFDRPDAAGQMAQELANTLS